jgi:histidyl-tRNA synthetase
MCDPTEIKKIIKEELNNCYSLQGAKLTNMEEQLIEIKRGLEKNDAQHKEITEDGRKQHQETMDKLEEISKTKADQVYVTKLESSVNTKAEKESFNELKKLVYWVLAFTATTLVGLVLNLLMSKLDKI